MRKQKIIKFTALLLMAYFLALPNFVLAQKVEITQETANKCSRCFDEVKELREQVVNLEKAGVKDKEAIDSLNRLISLYEKLLANKEEEAKELRATVKELIQAILTRPTKKCSGFIVLGC